MRSHWGLGSKLLADLYRPDLTDAAADHLAAVLRDSADRDVAAGPAGLPCVVAEFKADSGNVWKAHAADVDWQGGAAGRGTDGRPAG